MQQIKSIYDILNIADCDQLCLEYHHYLIQKKKLGSALNEAEEIVYLLFDLLPTIEIEGFADLFYQLYSLRECVLVETGLRRLGLNRLAGLFGEAKAIYTRGRINLTQEAYEQLGPFTFDGAEGRRFDDIDKMVLSSDSEIHLIGLRLCQYITYRSLIS